MREMTQEEIFDNYLKIMDAFHLFCVENNLVYSLGFGSLLGAVRHNGFIPWDDDIDVIMPRKDYERFCKSFSLPDFGVMTCYNNTKYIFPYAKVYMKNTFKKEPINPKNRFEIGLNIDLFPIDSVDSIQTFCKKQKRAKKLIFKRKLALLDYSSEKNPIKKILKILINIPFAKKTNFYAKKIDRCFATNTGESNLLLHNDIYYSKKKYIFDSNLFEKTISHKFENREYYILDKYDHFLEVCYGDYMTLPSVAERVTHHSFEAYYL